MGVEFVSYLRVSTRAQGRSSLALDAQRSAVSAHTATRHGRLLSELVEMESGKRNDRPRFAEALAFCRLHGATLLITKLDRLSHDTALPARTNGMHGSIYERLRAYGFRVENMAMIRLPMSVSCGRDSLSAQMHT